SKGCGPREQVQEPLIAARRKIEVLLKVRSKTIQVRPIRRHADTLPIEARWRERREGKSEPGEEQYPKSGEPLAARPGKGDQEEQRIAQPNLGEHIGENPISLFAPGGSEKYGQHNQPQ